MLRQTLRCSFYKGGRRVKFSDNMRRHKHSHDGKALYLQQSQQYIRRDGERWWIIDCAGEELQQVADVCAAYLLGMNRPDFRPGTIAGDHVVVLNTSEVVMVGDQWIRTPMNFRNGNWPAGKFSVRMSEVFDKDPSMVLWYWTQKRVNEFFVGKRHVLEAPMEKLWLYPDAVHPHWDMNPRPIQWTSDKERTPYVPENSRLRWRYNYAMRISMDHRNYWKKVWGKSAQDNAEKHTGETITHWRTTWDKRHGNWQKWADEDARVHNNSKKIYNREDASPFDDDFDFDKERPKVGARFSKPGAWDMSDGWDDYAQKFSVDPYVKQQRERQVVYEGSSAWQNEEDARNKWRDADEKKQRIIEDPVEVAERQRLHDQQEVFVAWKQDRADQNEKERELRRNLWRDRAVAQARTQHEGKLNMNQDIPFEKQLQAYRVVGEQFDPNFDYLSNIHYPENDDIDDKERNVGEGTPEYEALKAEHIEHRDRVFNNAEALFEQRRDERVAKGGPRWDPGGFDHFAPFTSDAPGGNKQLNGEEAYMERLKAAGAAAIAAHRMKKGKNEDDDDDDDLNFISDIETFNQQQAKGTWGREKQSSSVDGDIKSSKPTAAAAESESLAAAASSSLFSSTGVVATAAAPLALAPHEAQVRLLSQSKSRFGLARTTQRQHIDQQGILVTLCLLPFTAVVVAMLIGSNRRNKRRRQSQR